MGKQTVYYNYLVGYTVETKALISHPFGVLYVTPIELCTFLPIQIVCAKYSTPKGWDINAFVFTVIYIHTLARVPVKPIVLGHKH